MLALTSHASDPSAGAVARGRRASVVVLQNEWIFVDEKLSGMTKLISEIAGFHYDWLVPQLKSFLKALQEVYETIAANFMEDVVDGYNATIFAYGQTGAGKHEHTAVHEHTAPEQCFLS